jgi:1-deoxy-D-xylulose-5-phosphate synthase
VLVHCITRKGAGYPPAEADDVDRLHTVPPAASSAPAAMSGTSGTSAIGPAWTDVFADELARLGDEREDLVAVTAAMLEPTGLQPFACRHPDRVYDVGIAEQHAVGSAAGLATAGLHPVVAIYSTFLNRAFDQVLMDVALHRLAVTFVLDRAGITGPDGPSHHGMWDLSLLAAVPGLRVAAPRDARTLRELLREAVAVDTAPTVVRFPRGRVGADLPVIARCGTADVLARPEGDGCVLLLAAGPLAAVAVAAARLLSEAGVPTTVVDPRWVQPLDPALAREAARHRLLVTIEDGCVVGGFGEAAARQLRDAGVAVPVATMGLPAGFVDVGERGSLLGAHGLDPDGVVRTVLAALPTLAPPEADGSGLDTRLLSRRAGDVEDPGVVLRGLAPGVVPSAGSAVAR